MELSLWGIKDNIFAMISLIIILLACHFVGDFAFQTEYLASNKGKSWVVNFIHAAVYTATFVIFAKVSVAFTALLLISHFIVDPLKSRYKIVKHLWIDQLIHIAIIVVGLLLGL